MRIVSYWGDADIGGCPSCEMDDDRPQYGPVDYAYSSILGRHLDWAAWLQGLGPEIEGGERLSSIHSPTQTAMIYDAARIAKEGDIGRMPWGYPPGGLVAGRPEATFHGRHMGSGNVGWADGHAGTFEPVFYDEYDPLAKEYQIGTIDEDGDISTGELFDLQ